MMKVAQSLRLRLTHFLGSRLLRVLCLSACGDAGLCCLCGSAVGLETSWCLAATDMRPSRGFTAMAAAEALEQTPLNTEFTLAQSIFIGWKVVCFPVFVVEVSSTKCFGKHTV